MIPLTPSFLISAAGGYVGVKEEGGNNRGRMVELFLGGVRMEAGQPWCAAFVHHVGYWSHFDYKARESFWPLPATASCYVLGEFARRRGILREEPAPGDVFLVYSPAHHRFAHTGIIVHVVLREPRASGAVWYECITIEGNTNAEGSREGNQVARKRRRFYPEGGDRFIHWVDLDKRSVAGDPVKEAQPDTQPDAPSGADEQEAA